MIEHKSSIKERLSAIRTKIIKASNRVNLYNEKKEEVELIAVSKNFEEDKIIPLLKEGHRVFGENRVQEAKRKWPKLKEKYSDIKLHLIGPLQTNKVRDAVKIFDIIETVDREKLAKKLRLEMDKQGKNIPCFVQVNIGQEQQKSGVEPSRAVEFVQKCRTDFAINIIGLMAIAPLNEASGPYFAKLAQLAKEAEVKYLSMGMSNDFEEAILLGATHIRVGTALFGSR